MLAQRKSGMPAARPALERPSTAAARLSALGTVPASSEAREPPQLRVVEVFDRPLKLRARCELTSQLIAAIEPGTRLKVLETHVTMSGTERLRVADVNGTKTLGWVTARKSRLGDYLLRDVPRADSSASSERIPHSHRSFARSSSVPPRTALRCLPPTSEHAPPTSDRSLLFGPELPWLVIASPVAKTGPTSLTDPLQPAGKYPLVFFTSSGSFGMGEERRLASTDPIRVRATVKNDTSESPSPRSSQTSPPLAIQLGTRSTLKPDPPPLDKNDETAFNSHVQRGSNSQKPPERATVKKAFKDQDARELPKSSELTAVAAALYAKADEAEANITKRSLDAQVGEAFRQRLKNHSDPRTSFIDTLIREWDPNRDGQISRMEFRTNIRTLLGDSNIDTGEIDKLFASLDLDNDGSIDSDELKQALKKLEQRTAKAAKSENGVYSVAAEYRRRAEAALECAAVLQKAEAAKQEYEKISKNSIGAELGALLRKKPQSIVKERYNKTDFASFCNGVGLSAPRPQLDALFDIIDDDGLGSLDTSKMRKAVKKLEDECEQMMADIRAAGQRSSDVIRSSKVLYDTWRATNEAEEKAEAERAASEKAKREADQAAKTQALANKRWQQEEEEKAKAEAEREFAQRVKLKRAQSQSKVKAGGSR